MGRGKPARVNSSSSSLAPGGGKCSAIVYYVGLVALWYLCCYFAYTVCYVMLYCNSCPGCFLGWA